MKKILSYLFVYLSKALLKLLLMSCRIEIRGLDSFISIASKYPTILMLWHDRLIILSEILEQFTSKFVYAAFISKSRDGDPLEILAHSYSRGEVIRVPHNARQWALHQMIQYLKERKVVLVTPDGPRGPRYVAKPGIAVAAKEAKAKVIPFSWTASNVWQLKTWDKLMIPKPFSKILVTFGSPLTFSKQDENSLEEQSSILTTSLHIET